MKAKTFIILASLVVLVLIPVFFTCFKTKKDLPLQKIDLQSTAQVKKCPTGFVLVPGNGAYGTEDFCVMKYDAKCTNTDPKCVTAEGVYKNNMPGCECQGKYQILSTSAGAPITFIPEDDGTEVSAKSYCTKESWHLITNPEWMTIARNVENVSDNWCNQDGTGCGNTPGTAGKILANGHNDSVPGKALPGGSDDQACFGTTADGTDKCGAKSSQKRTLTLSNGETIWDFPGNVWQWVDITVARKDEPRTIVPGFGNSRWTWGEFQTVPYDTNIMPSNPNWNSKNGVGRIYHFNSQNDTDTTKYTYIRAGNWRHGYDSGAFTVHMEPVPAKTNIDDIGFRCATKPM